MNWTDKIQVTNEDNMELMKRYPDNYFDLSIVDPPYRDVNQPDQYMRNKGSMKSLDGRPSKEYFNELKRVSKEQIIWGANNFELPQFKGFIVWDKKIAFGTNFSMAEIASVSEGIMTVSKIVEIRASGASNIKVHPTQKPVKLYEWLLMNYAKEGDKILDTHLGSGSIAIACHNLGFELTACELDKDYYEASYKRFKQVTSQTQLF